MCKFISQFITIYFVVNLLLVFLVGLVLVVVLVVLLTCLLLIAIVMMLGNQAFYLEILVVHVVGSHSTKCSPDLS